jgi:hypothetical protein
MISIFFWGGEIPQRLVGMANFDCFASSAACNSPDNTKIQSNIRFPSKAMDLKNSSLRRESAFCTENAAIHGDPPFCHSISQQ